MEKKLLHSSGTPQDAAEDQSALTGSKRRCHLSAMRWSLSVLLGWMILRLHASTITDPSVIIAFQNGNTTLNWNSAIASPVIVEHSLNLSTWVSLSQNNTAGFFEHAAGSSTKGFYRLKWMPSLPPTPAMITVQGGTLPQSSEFAGQRVASFQIGKYEVTWDEWLEVRAWAVNNGYSDLANAGVGTAANHPVRKVNWYDVVKWSNSKSEKEGFTPAYIVKGATYRTGQSEPTISSGANGFRLPSEVEWEWAARGGVNGGNFTYSGSDDVSHVAWYRSNSGYSGTRAIGIKAPNELGIYDMSGNVREWVSALYYRLRGGSWISQEIFCKVASREIQAYQFGDDYTGFRLARNAP